MDQVLWVPGLNYSEHWNRWNMIRPRASLQENGAHWILWHNNPPGASHMGGVWERQVWSARTILEGLLKVHSHSLNDESLRTLMAEVQLIINLRPLTVETISESKSEIPSSNLLTMKTSVVMPPPGKFSKPDAYSKRRWRRVQHIAREFWSRWRKEFLQSLQVRQIWKKRIRNFAVGDIVLLRHDCHQNQWPMARIVSIDTDAKNDVVSVTLWVADKKGGPSQILKQPITKLVLLVENEFDSLSDRAITKLTKWELFFGESDIVVWYGLKDTHREKAP